MEPGWKRTRGAELISRWPKYFTHFNTSPSEFYESVEAALAKHEIPGLEVSRVIWKEGSFLSADREYLRIGRRRLVYDICAAPFGRDFFFSAWLVMLRPTLTIFHLIGMATTAFFFYFFVAQYWGVAKGGSALIGALLLIWVFVRAGGFRGPVEVEEFLLGLTLFGGIWNVFKRGISYFEYDTALMFQASVHSSVLEVLDALTDAKSLPRMSDSERKPINRDFFRR